MPLQVPLNSDPYQLFDMQLTQDEPAASFFVWWNNQDESWNISINTREGPIIGMKRMVLNQYLLPNGTRFHGGNLIVLGNSDPRNINSFVADNSLIWFTGEELGNAGS